MMKMYIYNLPQSITILVYLLGEVSEIYKTTFLHKNYKYPSLTNSNMLVEMGTKGKAEKHEDGDTLL